MANILDKVFGSYSEHQIKKINPIVKKIEALAPKMKELTNAEMLEMTMKSVDEIASESKFVSTNFFIKCFKARYGHTPDEYRKMLRLEKM